MLKPFQIAILSPVKGPTLIQRPRCNGKSRIISSEDLQGDLRADVTTTCSGPVEFDAEKALKDFKREVFWDDVLKAVRPYSPKIHGFDK